MNSTLTWNVGKLSISPREPTNVEVLYKQRAALLIFIAIWLLIFVIDTLLRCREIIKGRRRRHPLIFHTDGEQRGAGN